MKIYILLHEQDTDSSWGGSAAPYLDKESAQAAMRKELDETVKSWGYNSREHHDEDECSCSDNSAVLRDGINAEHWSIKEFELDVRAAVEVKGGLVTDVFY